MCFLLETLTLYRTQYSLIHASLAHIGKNTSNSIAETIDHMTLATVHITRT